ncbi:MAG TPA: hypothetical protein ENH28_06225 [Euryarchaeota archaeon]|nr:hypothetical protein BMS3Bbin15_01317 [archaeon BMS3Bbin15]HDL15729.1 hypothetical protein [Euryarchaeota archaeon]
MNNGLRKFFRSQLATAIPVDIVETLMGHEGYLTGDRRYSEKELGEYYSKGEHNFTYYSSGQHGKPLQLHGYWELYFERKFRIIFTIDYQRKIVTTEAIKHKDEF